MEKEGLLYYKEYEAFYEMAEKYNAHIITTLHDLYTMCPAINMVYKGTYCEDSKNCKDCILDKYNIFTILIDSYHLLRYHTFKEFFYA